MATEGKRERRWIILGDDGWHVTVGRHTDPSPEEVDRAAEILRQTGAGGWLAVTDGLYYGRGGLSVMMVREIAPSRRTWEEALVLFHGTRKRSVAAPSP
jgi:hypothetical protein